MPEHAGPHSASKPARAAPPSPQVLVEYPCTMLNIEVDKNYNNSQYQTLDAGAGGYAKQREMSIAFEVRSPFTPPTPNPNPQPHPNTQRQPPPSLRPQPKRPPLTAPPSP